MMGNLWIFFILGYGFIWIGMILASKKRGKAIEDPETYRGRTIMQIIGLGMVPQVLPLFPAFFIRISSGALFWSGFIIFMSGIFLDLISMFSFSKETEGLNTKGIYRWSRNPMYLGGFLFLLGLNIMGAALSLANIFMFVLTLLWTGITHWHVLQEEKFLSKKYGDSYIAYLLQTPRYIGILRRKK